MMEGPIIMPFYCLSDSKISKIFSSEVWPTVTHTVFKNYGHTTRKCISKQKSISLFESFRLEYILHFYYNS